jgi:hypothetical protein
LTEAQTALAQATPETMTPLMEGYCERVLASTSGGVAQRWVLISSEPCRPQTQRMVDMQGLHQSTAEVKAFQTLCRPAFACEAEAPQALRALGQDVQATHIHQSTIYPIPRYAKRGRPSPAALPDQGVYQSAGPLASAVVAHKALVVQHSCFMLATHELDESALSPR